MKFGKLDAGTHINFMLPPNAFDAGTIFRNAGSARGMLYTGTTSWTQKEWVGNAYPPGTRQKDFLHAYGNVCNAIELNTMFYRIPKTETILRWRDSVPEGFKFCPKLLQWISKSRDLGTGTDRITAFCDAVMLFEGKLGMCFMQLPPHFDLKRRDILMRFLDVFPAEIPLAIEFRHESWFEGHVMAEEIFAYLREKQCAMVITDVAGRRDVLHMRLTTPRTMIRFVGHDGGEQDTQRLREWRGRLSAWFNMGLEEAYFFVHQSDARIVPGQLEEIRIED